MSQASAKKLEAALRAVSEANSRRGWSRNDDNDLRRVTEQAGALTQSIQCFQRDAPKIPPKHHQWNGGCLGEHVGNGLEATLFH